MVVADRSLCSTSNGQGTALDSSHTLPETISLSRLNIKNGSAFVCKIMFSSFGKHQWWRTLFFFLSFLNWITWKLLLELDLTLKGSTSLWILFKLLSHFIFPPNKAFYCKITKCSSNKTLFLVNMHGLQYINGSILVLLLWDLSSLCLAFSDY